MPTTPTMSSPCWSRRSWTEDTRSDRPAPSCAARPGWTRSAFLARSSSGPFVRPTTTTRTPRITGAGSGMSAGLPPLPMNVRLSYLSESARRKALPARLHEDNHHRPHSAIGKVSSITRSTNLPGLKRGVPRPLNVPRPLDETAWRRARCTSLRTTIASAGAPLLPRERVLGVAVLVAVDAHWPLLLEGPHELQPCLLDHPQ